MLQAAGFRVTFELLSLDEEGYIRYNLRFVLEPGLGGVVLQSTAPTIAARDLEHLMEYLEEHMSQLVKDPDRQGHVFLEYELGFQLQASSGGASDDASEGSFTILFLVNVGRAKEEGANSEIGTYVYAGAESTVAFSQVRSFVTSVRSALESMRH
ncbi:MAG TPA: hypothetical protein VF914_15080 [Chloroflexia bacterium]